MARKVKLGIAAALAVCIAAAPAAAQQTSDSYTFLKAVKDRDGAQTERLLVKPSSSVLNARDASSGDGALHIVARGRDLAWLGFLLGKGARPDIQNKDGATPLAIAAQIGWVQGADLLLKLRASVDLPSRRGETPLILATQNRDVEMVQLLLSKGADPKRSDSAAGLSAIDYARRDPRAANILKLLDAGAKKPARQVAGPKL